ncbi:MAG: DUF302 domain-containing protein [Thiogranum sp.]|jgi:uncharacterized protein (DUF302 family)
MQKGLLVVVLSILAMPLAYAADNGLITLKSPYSVDQTLDRFEQALKSKGMTVFTRIDHAKGAAGVDLKLRPTTVLIFGNPKIGTLLMQSQQTAGIDLPLKLLAWQDADGQVWIAYNDPGYIAERHDIKDRDPVIAKMRKAMGNFTAQAIAK